MQKEVKEFYPGAWKSHVWKGNYLEISTDAQARVRIYVLEQDIFRFRYATSLLFEEDFSYAINPHYRPSYPVPSIEETDQHILLSTSKLRCVVNKQNLKITILDLAYHILCEDEKGFHWEVHPRFGTDIVEMSKKVQEGEAFYGLGDKAADQNLRGQRFSNWGTDTYGFSKTADPLYKNINLYYGYHHDKAYGIFMDNSFHSFFDFGRERDDVCSFWADGGEMNYYFINGPHLMDVALRYAMLTGTPEMPPLWALGYQQCKWSYYPESKVREITSKLREYQIPCDAIYLDIDYMDGFRCFTWDAEKFPDPKKMIADFSEQGFKTMVIIDPGIKIDFDYSVFTEALGKGYFCRRSDGAYAQGKVWPGDCLFPDFTRREVREWWATLFEELIEKQGIAGVWNDMNEPALFEVDSKTMHLDVRHDYDGHPCSHRKAHNVYGMQMARATLDGVKKFAGNKRPLVITRSGYAGFQRYSSTWTGDNVATWEHLEIAHLQTQRLAISGVSFSGSDVGGFTERPTGELYARWVALAAFHPFFRTHSSGDHGDQEPWSFGKEYMDYARVFINLRYRLLPYIYTCFFQHHRFGVPMLRPMLFDRTVKDEKFIDRSDECMLGDHLLYCPVLEEGVTSRSVLLPDGQWYDYWTNRAYSGGRSYKMPAPLDRIPLMVRGGAVIPQFPLMQYVGEKEVEQLELRVYFSESEIKSNLYTDSNDGYEYQKKKYRWSEFLFKGATDSATLEHSYAGEFVPPYTSLKISFIGCPFPITSASVDGVEMVDQGEIDGNIFVLNVDPTFNKVLLLHRF